MSRGLSDVLPDSVSCDAHHPNGSQDGMSGEKMELNGAEEAHFFAKTRSKLIISIEKDSLTCDGFQPLFFPGSSVCGGARFRARSAGVGVAVGKGLFAAEAKRGEELDL